MLTKLRFQEGLQIKEDTSLRKDEPKSFIITWFCVPFPGCEVWIRKKKREADSKLTYVTIHSF